MIHHRLAIPLALALLAACGGDQSSLDEAETGVETGELSPEQVETPAVAEQSNTAPLSVEDIDRWRQGMAAELEAVEAAAAALGQSTTADDTLNAIGATTEMTTQATGAAAAGVGEDRYRFIRTTLSSAVRNLTPLDMEMDTGQMPPQMIEQFEQGRAASLQQLGDVVAADLVESLRPLAAELRQQEMALVAARLRVAEAAR